MKVFLIITVCSYLVAYAFGFVPNYMDYEFNDDVKRYNAPVIVGSNNLGKSRVQQACLPEDGVCTSFTLCKHGSIKLKPNGVAVNGHDDMICSGIYEVCCTPDTKRVEDQKDRYKTSTTSRFDY